MLKKLFIATTLIAGVGLISCSKDYCGDLAAQVCKQAPDTKACQKAKTLTNKTTCKGFLADVKGFITLTNKKITKPPLKPPAQPVKKVEKTPVKPATTPKPAATAKPTQPDTAKAADAQKPAAPKAATEKPKAEKKAAEPAKGNKPTK